MQSAAKKIYRRYRSGTTYKTYSLSPETVEGLDRIVKAFSSRLSGPTHSAILEAVLVKRFAYYEENPQALAEDVADYERRFGS